MFVVTISFTLVDDLQTTGKNSVGLLLYRSYYVSFLQCFDVIVCLRYNKCFKGSVCFGGGTSQRFPIFCSEKFLGPSS